MKGIIEAHVYLLPDKIIVDAFLRQETVPVASIDSIFDNTVTDKAGKTAKAKFKLNSESTLTLEDLHLAYVLELDTRLGLPFVAEGHTSIVYLQTDRLIKSVSPPPGREPEEIYKMITSAILAK